MFIAMCDYFRWNVNDIDKPFESEEAWSLNEEDSENSEVVDDTASADEDSPVMNDSMKEVVNIESGDTEEVADEAGENSGIFAESE